MTLTSYELKLMLERLSIRLYGNKEYVRIAGLPAAADGIARDLWVKEIPDDGDTRVLRHQIQYLEKHGRFDLEGVPDILPGDVVEVVTGPENNTDVDLVGATARVIDNCSEGLVLIDGIQGAREKFLTGMCMVPTHCLKKIR